jgi:hypothetical protein
VTAGFPKATRSALTGELGVNLVCRIVIAQLGWMFRRNHNEHDFGIDGYIDLVTEDGLVTGRSIAVQIKYGESYLSHRERDGFTYYGQPRHLNYLLNHPVPVIVILCEPGTELCYWQQFDPEALEPTDTGWKLCVSYENTLSAASKGRLEDIAGPARDYGDQLREYWRTNQIIADAGSVLCPVERENHIERLDTAPVIAFFKGLRRTKSFARRNQGKFELFVSGYDDDPRELWEIPEVVAWMKIVEPEVKYWFYFLRTEAPAFSLRLLAHCVCGARLAEDIPRGPGDALQLYRDPVALSAFLQRNFDWLNEIALDLGLAETEIRKISFAAASCAGIAIPEDV